MIPSMIFYALFFILKFDFYTEEDHWAMCLVLFIIYGVNLVLLTYFLSFLFKSVG